MNLASIKEHFRDIRVLYAEDDNDAHEQFLVVLNNLFDFVVSAHDGEEAFRLFQETDGIDLVITDITMPKMNGIELIHEIHAIKPSTRCIIVSAHSQEEYLFKSINEDINGYIYKPVNLNQLVNVLMNTCSFIKIEKEKERYKKQLENVVKLQGNQIKEKNMLLLEKTVYDDLTKVYSRAKFSIDTDSKENYVLIMVSLKNFSSINMAFGFDVGDELLKSTADFLRQFSEDVYRPESNKFLIVLWNKNSEEALEFSKDILNKSKSERFNVGIHYPIQPIFSVGIADGEIDSSVSIRKAYTALKMADKNLLGIYLYKDALKFEESQKELINWVNKTKHAIDNDLIVPFFQPIYNLNSNKIEKFECLARMKDEPDIIPPAKFLNAAKQAGMLTRITKIMIDKSFDYFKDKKFDFSINVTNEDLKNADIVEYIMQKAKEFSLEPSRVCIEILENIPDKDYNLFLQQLRVLKTEGFQLSVDDFGAESSNFSRLLSLDIDYIKIDGMFIKDIDTETDKRTIAQTVVFYAKKTNKKTIAEFVCSDRVLKTVKEIGVDYAQGYVISKPVKDIEQCLKSF